MVVASSTCNCFPPCAPYPRAWLFRRLINYCFWCVCVCLCEWIFNPILQPCLWQCLVETRLGAFGSTGNSVNRGKKRIALSLQKTTCKPEETAGSVAIVTKRKLLLHFSLCFGLLKWKCSVFWGAQKPPPNHERSRSNFLHFTCAAVVCADVRSTLQSLFMLGKRRGFTLCTYWGTKAVFSNISEKIDSSQSWLE